MVIMDPSRLLYIVLACLSVHLSVQHGYEIDPDQDPENTLRRSDFIRDKEHLKEHLQDIDFDPEKASPEELDFHFFNLHDLNGDDQLDGLELLLALQHQVVASRRAREEAEGSLLRRNPNYDRVMLRHNIAMVDKILEDDDADKNGYVNYAEFAHTRRASELLQQIGATKKT